MEILIALAATLIIGLQLYGIFRPKTSTSDDQALHAQTAELNTRLAVANESLSNKDATLLDFQSRLSRTEQFLAEANSQAANFQARIAQLNEALMQERKQSAEAHQRLTQEFKVLANEVMKSHSESFTKQNKEQIDNILAPLKEKIGEFQKETIDARAALAAHIGTLTERSALMTAETSNLTRALKGESQTQGAWGEMILESILEKSGLREGEEYSTQSHHTNESGDRLRSDVIVKLPGDQRIVIDSKLSLTAFNDYVNAPTAADRAAALKRHLASLRNHIKILAGKEYHSVAQSHLDYVVMFIPIEGALAAALQEDPGLTASAVENNVAIATPTTLMIALRTVASIWQGERRNRNVEEIARQAGGIYEKLVGFLEDMGKIKAGLANAQNSYDGAMNKLSAGKGNLVTRVETLKKLGAKTNKSIPENYLEDDADSPPEIAASAGA